MEASAPATKSRSWRPFVGVGAVAVILLLILFYGLGGLNTSSSGTVTTTTSTSYGVTAASLLSSVASDAPPGYLQGSTKQLTPDEAGLVSAGYQLYSNQGGALANMTVIVFNSTTSAQRYGDSVINNAKALGGYSDVTSILGGYERYGSCYGYAEADPEGGEYVANGVCVDGNVYVFVHLASTSSLASAESDMAAFMGAVYQGA